MRPLILQRTASSICSQWSLSVILTWNAVPVVGGTTLVSTQKASTKCSIVLFVLFVLIESSCFCWWESAPTKWFAGGVDCVDCSDYVD